MKWFDRWFARKCRWAWENRDLAETTLPQEKLSSAQAIGRESDLSGNSRMHFNVHRANGGLVIETQFYDRRTDRHNQNLHIITSDQNIGEELGKIITLESLKL
jgi:hypothetical protein